MKPFVTDEELVARLRVVAADLEARGLRGLAREVTELARILEPEESRP